MNKFDNPRSNSCLKLRQIDNVTCTLTLKAHPVLGSIFLEGMLYSKQLYAIIAYNNKLLSVVK